MYNFLSFSLGKGEFLSVIQDNIALQVFDKKYKVVGGSCGPAEEQQWHWRSFASGLLEASAVDGTDRHPLGRTGDWRDRLVVHRSWIFWHISGVLSDMVCTNHSYYMLQHPNRLSVYRCSIRRAHAGELASQARPETVTEVHYFALLAIMEKQKKPLERVVD